MSQADVDRFLALEADVEQLERDIKALQEKANTLYDTIDDVYWTLTEEERAVLNARPPVVY